MQKNALPGTPLRPQATALYFSELILKYILLALIALAQLAHGAKPVLGEGVAPEKALEIVSIFNSGALLVSGGVVVDELPKGAGEHIYSINIKDGKYVVQINSFVCTNSWHHVRWACDIKTIQCEWVVDPEYKCREI